MATIIADLELGPFQPEPCMQTHSNTCRSPGLRAAHESSGRRRLSITTVPVYQPLKFRQLGRSAQPNEPVAPTDLKRVSVQGAGVLHDESTPGLTAGDCSYLYFSKNVMQLDLWTYRCTGLMLP